MEKIPYPYTLVGPPFKEPVLAPLTVYSSTTVYIFTLDGNQRVIFTLDDRITTLLLQTVVLLRVLWFFPTLPLLGGRYALVTQKHKSKI